jgi:uncharacterized integral membrane protein
MQKKVLFFTIVIALFLAVLFLDQNSAPVPVKIILGDPHLIGLSSIIVVSVLVGVLLAVAVLYAKKAVLKAVRKNQPSVE